MNRSQKRLGYFIAILASLVVLLLRMALYEALAEQARLLPFVVAVMAAAWWGGLKPGLLATALGAFFGVLFVLPPPFSLEIDTFADFLNTGIFIFVGVMISYVCEALHVAHRRESEKQFQALANSMPQLVWMAQPNGHRFWFNERWYEYSGATVEQSKGIDWQQFCDPAELPRVQQSWQAALVSKTPWEETYPLRRKDGQMRWHLARAVPVKDEHGDVLCWFGTSTDIEGRIEAERVLKETDARKDQFLATLAHELRNPLAPISNALELWPHVADDRAELEHLREVIARQVQQLVRLIDDLMDLSRIACGKISLRRQRVELAGVIGAAVESVQPAVDDRHHHLSVAVPNEPLAIHGDAVRLTQVFSNILNNAAKYTPGKGQISVVVERRAADAVVTIRDNGPGIPPGMLKDIFAAFRQVDSSLGRSQGGLGIGLWLASQIVELHGGTIEARSQGTGQGSEFVVTLPALEPTKNEPEVDQPEQLPASMTLAGRHRILVVDDLRESAETLAMVLASLGQDATAMSDAGAVVGWVLAHRPDAVFLDIAMPGLDGYELARRLRARPELRDLVLVALTGYGQQEDRRRAFEAGFNSHLTKPTKMTVLRDLLATLPLHPLEAVAHS